MSGLELDTDQLAKGCVCEKRVAVTGSTIYLVSLTPSGKELTCSMDSTDLDDLVTQTVDVLTQEIRDPLLSLGAHPGVRGKLYVMAQGWKQWEDTQVRRTLRTMPQIQGYVAGGWMLLRSVVDADEDQVTGGPSVDGRGWESYRGDIHDMLHDMALARWGGNGYMQVEQASVCPFGEWETLTRLATYRGDVGNNARKALSLRGEIEQGRSGEKWTLAGQLVTNHPRGLWTDGTLESKVDGGEVLRKVVQDIIDGSGEVRAGKVT